MKNITKDNKGITLIALILTIIIMLILVSVTTYTGLNTYRFAQVNKFITQMQLLQAKVDDLVSTKTAEELDSMELESGVEYQKIIDNAYNNGNGEILSNAASKYKIFTKDKALEILDVDDLQNDIMVNFETREIVDVVGIEYEGNTYYTQYKLPGGQAIINNSNGPDRDLLNFNTEIDSKLYNSLSISIDGLNATIEIDDIQIINATLCFAETDSENNKSNWQIITNYTETNKSYDVVISKSGNYIFKLQDNVKNDNSIEITITIQLANKPKTDSELEQYNYRGDSDEWAYAQKDDANYYVWIPRFAYDIENNIKFIKGNSNITTYNKYIGDELVVHSKFTRDDNVEITGIWVSVNPDEVKKKGLNMITLVSDTTRTTLEEI